MSSAVIAMRIEMSKCAVCNHFIVDAYLCDGCSFNSNSIRRDDPSSVTATDIGAAARRQTERSAAHEQWMNLIGPTPRTITMRRASNECCHFTTEELARWQERLDSVTSNIGETARKSRAMAKRSRGRAHRRRWLRFVDVWARLGLAYLGDVVAPTKVRVRLPSRMLEALT